jgi:hypothetical protein
MGDIQATQALILAAVTTGNDARVVQAHIKAATQFPSEEVRTTQGHIKAAVQYGNVAIVTASHIKAAVRGRIYDPRIRSWTYTQDGHDYYITRLGGIDKTLVYDLHSQQWYVWGTRASQLWRPYDGVNWLGAGYFADSYGSNVVVGDDGNGSLYFLDPNYDYDDNHLVGDENPGTFERVAMALILSKDYASKPCFGVILSGSQGETANDLALFTGVKLEVSDDVGHTYTDMGTITTTDGDYNQRVHWRSLGSVRQPGRIFKITDDGTLKRIDSLEMEDGSPPDSGS